MSFFISDALAQTAPGQAPAGPSLLMNVLFIGGLFLFMYFVMIRPQRKRQKEHADMLSALAKGDEVVTSAGMLGKVVRVEDDYVLVKVAENVELRFQKHAISAVLPKGTLKSV
jgi:preprotein translocase subunit YajC